METDLRFWKRLCGIVIAPAVLFIFFVVLAVACQHDVPNPLGTHWGWGQVPDGSTDGFTLFIVDIVIFLLLWLMPCVEWGVRSQAARRVYSIVPAAYGMGLIIGIEVADIVANWHAVSWETAKALNPWCILLMAFLPSGLCLGAYVVESDFSPFYLTPSGQWPTCLPDLTHAIHSKNSRPPVYARKHGSEKAAEVWRGKSINWGIAAIMATIVSLLSGLIGVVAWSTDGTSFGLVCMMTIVAVGLFFFFVLTGADVSVRVYQRTGIIISMGPFRLIRRKIHFAQIVSISGTRVEAMDNGGWGIRRRGHKTIYIIRSGEAIQFLTKEGARDVICTVDRMHEGVEIATREMAAFLESVAGLEEPVRNALAEVDARQKKKGNYVEAVDVESDAVSSTSEPGAHVEVL